MKNSKNKNIRRKVMGLALLAVLSIGSMVSCDITGLTDAVDDFAVIIGLEPINTSANVLITDAKTGELVDANVSIIFAGENGEDVIDIYSDPLPEDITNDGILTFGLNNSVAPDESSPARVQLLMEADGYVSASKNVVFAGEGTSRFSLKLVKENDKPQGVKTTSSTVGNTNEQGTVETDFTVESISDESSDAGTSVEVSSGTVFKDENGNNLTGQLSTSVTYYNPEEPSAMLSQPEELIDEDGNPFIVAGISQIQITDANGRVATSAANSTTAKSAQAEGPVSIKFKIPSSYGANVGDELSVFTNFPLFNIPKLVVQEDGDGSLFVVYTAESNRIPSRLTIGVWWRATGGNYCSSNISINRNGNAGTLRAAYSFPGYASERYLTPGFSFLGGGDYVGGFFPSNRETLVEVTTPYGETVTRRGNICSSGGFTIDLPEPPPTIIEATVNVSLKCKNPGEVVSVTSIPTAAILYRKSGTTGDWQNAEIEEWYQDSKERITGGSFSVSGVEQGENYDFTIKIDTEKRSRSIEIAGPVVDYEETLDSGVCSS